MNFWRHESPCMGYYVASKLRSPTPGLIHGISYWEDCYLAMCVASRYIYYQIFYFDGPGCQFISYNGHAGAGRGGIDRVYRGSALAGYRLPVKDQRRWVWLKELNPRRRVYVEIPKPARVELKCSQNPQTYHRYNFPNSFYCTFNAI
jgi:hypothetical protein